MEKLMKYEAGVNILVIKWFKWKGSRIVLW